ncbi:MAG: thioredoxin family protein [Candidatus Hodarchaeota archaeon]
MNDQDDEELKKLRLKKLEQMKHRIQNTQHESNKGVMELNSANFYEVINKAELSIVDLWADWCMPCKIMAPIFKKLANSPEYNEILFCSLNSDLNQQILLRYGVMGIPTFLIFSKGTLIEKVIGAVGEAALRNVLNNILQKSKLK